MLNELWLLVSVVILFIGLVASQGLLLVLGALSLIVSLVAKFWDRVAFQKVTHFRTLSHARAFVGDTVEYVITLSNEKAIPLIWVDIQDAFPEGLELPGGSVRGSGVEVIRQHCITTSLLPYQKVTWKYKIECTARGYHRIGPVRLRSGDIFGFSSAEIYYPKVEHLLVYPKIVDLGELIFPEQHPLGESKSWKPVVQDTTRFLRQRDYSPVDPMKHIDWKATARKQRLQTKVFEPVVSLNVLIALNAATSEYAWQGSNRRFFERAVTAAASVASDADRHGYTYGLISNAVASYSGKWLSVPMGASSSQLSMILESLAMAGPYVVTPLTEVLKGERASLPSGTTVVLVTSILTRAMATEINLIKDSGYQVRVLYTGDQAPSVEMPGVPIVRLGRILETQVDYEPAMA
ncbi:MAG: hypothetical protein CL702_05645 [Chloroflexi bacterium]|nr:hypothetical protein [Chloroflexota bacterium]